MLVSGCTGRFPVAVTLLVTVRQVRQDGTEAPLDGKLAAALSGPAEQFVGFGGPVRWQEEYNRQVNKIRWMFE